jgi:hypothetical protein
MVAGSTPAAATMNVIKKIPISHTTYDEVKRLPCVVSVNKETMSVVYLDLDGRSCEARNGDYLVCFASGIWQRFGSEAAGKLAINPNGML